MKLLLIALVSTLTMSVSAHSILPLPSVDIESIESINLFSKLTYENFLSINKVEMTNLSCAEEAWAFGDEYAAGYENYYGFPPTSQDVYFITNAIYENCVNPRGHSGNYILDSPAYLLQ